MKICEVQTIGVLSWEYVQIEKCLRIRKNFAVGVEYRTAEGISKQQIN